MVMGEKQLKNVKRNNTWTELEAVFFVLGVGRTGSLFKKAFVNFQYQNSCTIGFSFSQSAPKEKIPKESSF